jgi:hypothetical protein
LAVDLVAGLGVAATLSDILRSGFLVALGAGLAVVLAAGLAVDFVAGFAVDLAAGLAVAVATVLAPVVAAMAEPVMRNADVTRAARILFISEHLLPIFDTA